MRCAGTGTTAGIAADVPEATGNVAGAVPGTDWIAAAATGAAAGIAADVPGATGDVTGAVPDADRIAGVEAGGIFATGSSAMGQNVGAGAYWWSGTRTLVISPPNIRLISVALNSLLKIFASSIMP
jgi:hypothetical protein